MIFYCICNVLQDIDCYFQVHIDHYSTGLTLLAMQICHEYVQFLYSAQWNDTEIRPTEHYIKLDTFRATCESRCSKNQGVLQWAICMSSLVGY